MGLDLMDVAVLNAHATRVAAEAELAAATANANNTNVTAEAALAIAAMQNQHNSLIDKYNKLAEDNEYNKAGYEFLVDVVRDNLEHIPATREEINQGLNAAREAALEKFRAQN